MENELAVNQGDKHVLFGEQQVQKAEDTLLKKKFYQYLTNSPASFKILHLSLNCASDRNISSNNSTTGSIHCCLHERKTLVEVDTQDKLETTT